MLPSRLRKSILVELCLGGTYRGPVRWAGRPATLAPVDPRGVPSWTSPAELRPDQSSVPLMRNRLGITPPLDLRTGAWLAGPRSSGRGTAIGGDARPAPGPVAGDRTPRLIARLKAGQARQDARVRRQARPSLRPIRCGLVHARTRTPQAATVRCTPFVLRPHRAQLVRALGR